ncbi:myotubularin-related protein 2 [Platysternon megacephalum]|uniref:Myotubularin-related protein 2 n=1 Tax=Platysternon megacephalum TaxID=55544 RepID=A0A4D9E035_9SAUR|nr:myotubularin-related protein 2 [Platysternon megacephalum]
MVNSSSEGQELLSQAANSCRQNSTILIALLNQKEMNGKVLRKFSQTNLFLKCDLTNFLPFSQIISIKSKKKKNQGLLFVNILVTEVHCMYILKVFISPLDGTFLPGKEKEK